MPRQFDKKDNSANYIDLCYIQLYCNRFWETPCYLRHFSCQVSLHRVGTLVWTKCLRCPSGVVDRLRGKRKWPILMALLLVRAKCVRCPSGVVDVLRGKCKWPLLMALLVQAKCMRCPSGVVNGLHGKRKWPLLMALFFFFFLSFFLIRLLFSQKGLT